MELFWAIENLTPSAFVDILIVTLLFFGLSFLFRGTQAVALFRGTVILYVSLIVISNVFQFQALNWLLTNLLTVLAVAVPVIFQPELRRGLERLGSGSAFLNRMAPDTQRQMVINEVVQAAEKLAERRHGALIVLQRKSNLEDYIRTGIPMNSDVNAQIFLTIFWPKTELHDGAAIIDSAGRMAAAACVLPLTASRNLPSRKMGTRHRAALGISEVSDALCVIVSEETGKIAITNGGRMVPRLEPDRLRTLLNAFYGAQEPTGQSPIGRVYERFKKGVLSLVPERQG